MDYDRFKKSLNTPLQLELPLTDQEIVEAHRNLTGFMGVLVEINKRVGLVPLDGGVHAQDK